MVPVPDDPARAGAALVRVHVGSLLTRETAPGARLTDGTSTIQDRRYLVRTLFPDTRPYDVFHG